MLSTIIAINGMKVYTMILGYWNGSVSQETNIISLTIYMLLIFVE